MAKKVILKDLDNVEILPITRGELIVDSSGKEAFHSNEFLATNSLPGLMSPEEKAKISTIAGNTIDSALSTTSTNPVQNKVVTVAINEAKQLANDALETANDASENVSKVQQILNSIKESYLKSATVDGNVLTIVDLSDSEITFTNTTYNTFLKETAANTGGRNGLVPKPNYNNGSKTRFLREDGTWVIPTNTSYTFANGTDGSFTVTPSGGSSQKVTIGKPATAGTADKVAKSLTLKIKTGATEGTDLYTYDGSAAKTLDIKAGANITLTPTAGVLTIAATNSNTTYILSGALDGNTFVTTLTPSSGTATTAVIPAMVGATSSAAGKAGLVPAPAANKHTSFLRGDGTWVVPTDTKNTAGSTNSTSKLFLIGATSQAANPQTYSNSSVYTTNGTLYATTFVGNLDGTYVNKLTGYKIAEAIGSISATDSLNTALGKLEFKTDFIYNDLFGTDNDDVINKWHEIVDFVDSVTEGTDITDEFVTRKTAQTITGEKIFSGTSASLLTIDRNSTNPAWVKFAKNNNLLGYIGIDNDKKPVVNIDGTVYYILHSGNSFIKDGVITINGTSITPLTAHQSLANYVTLNTNQTINGVKTFSTQLKFTVADGTAPFTVTSKTVVTNLNADLLDGTHKSGLLTALANVNTTDNPLSIYVTVGGTTKYLKVSYSQHSTDLVNTSVTNPDSAVSGQYLKWYSQINRSGSDPYYAGTNTGFPVGNNANGILWLGTYSGPYGGLLGVSSNGRLYYRFITNNTFPTTANGGSWKTLAWTSDIPTSLKNPAALTIFGVSYDGSSAKTITANTMIGTLSEGSSDVTDGTEILTSYASDNGFADTNALNTLYKRDASKFYNYIKTKLKGEFPGLQNTAFYKRSTSVNGTAWDMAGTVNSAAFTIFAPTTAGTSGYILQSNGSGEPSWIALSSITAGDSDKLNGYHESSFFRYRDVLASNVDFNNYYNGIYVNTTGNGSGNSNNPTTYGYLLAFPGAGSSSYFAGVQINMNTGGSLQTRSHWKYAWSSWKTILDSDNSSVSGGGSSWGSSITVKINGTSKTLTIPSNPNTDSKVSLSETTTSSYRPVILGYTSSSTAGSGMTTSTTNVVYASNKFYALPSTGELYATTFVGALSGNATTANGAYYVYDYNATTTPIYIGYSGAALTTATHFAAYSTTSSGARCIKDMAVATVKSVLGIPTVYFRNIGVNGTNWTFYSSTTTAAASFYAPTSAGTSGYILQSSGGTPTWTARQDYSNPGILWVGYIYRSSRSSTSYYASKSGGKATFSLTSTPNSSYEYLSGTLSGHTSIMAAFVLTQAVFSDASTTCYAYSSINFGKGLEAGFDTYRVSISGSTVYIRACRMTDSNNSSWEDDGFLCTGSGHDDDARPVARLYLMIIGY